MSDWKSLWCRHQCWAGGSLVVHLFALTGAYLHPRNSNLQLATWHSRPRRLIAICPESGFWLFEFERGGYSFWRSWHRKFTFREGCRLYFICLSLYAALTSLRSIVVVVAQCDERFTFVYEIVEDWRWSASSILMRWLRRLRRISECDGSVRLAMKTRHIGDSLSTSFISASSEFFMAFPKSRYGT